MITEKQKQFFEKLKSKYGKEILPSFETIAQELGFKHKNSVWQYFNKFKDYGLIEEKNGRFSIAKALFGAIEFSSSVKAGFADVAEDAIEKRVSLDDAFEIDSPSTFIFTVSGDSMIDLGIFEGDKVIVKKCSEAKNGDVVIAYIDGGFTLKTYRKKEGKVWLEPANKNYPNLYPKEKLAVFGIAQGIVRKL